MYRKFERVSPAQRRRRRRTELDADVVDTHGSRRISVSSRILLVPHPAGPIAGAQWTQLCPSPTPDVAPSVSKREIMRRFVYPPLMSKRTIRTPDKGGGGVGGTYIRGDAAVKPC